LQEEKTDTDLNCWTLTIEGARFKKHYLLL